MRTLGRYLSLAILLAVFSSAAIYADNVSLEDNAPGVQEKVREFIVSKTQDRYGFKVGVVQAYINREDVSFDDISFDTDTGLVKANGSVTYKTGSCAVIKLSCTVDFDIKYNITTGDLEGAKLSKSFDHGIKIEFDLGTIKKVFEGNIAAALELIPNGGLVKRTGTSDYDERKANCQQKYGGKQYVYFASSDFVRWAGLETAGKWVGTLIATGGAGTTAIGAEVQTEMRKELTHVVAWLEANAGANAKQIADDLVSGKPIATPELLLGWQKVEYKSIVEVAGQRLPETPAIPHVAFYLVWKTSSTPSISPDMKTTTPVDDSAPRSKWKLGARYALGATGSRIVFVEPSGPAEKAGLKVGDVITKLDGKSIGVTDNKTDLVQKGVKATLDQQIDIEYLSNGASKSTTATLAPLF